MLVPVLLIPLLLCSNCGSLVGASNNEHKTYGVIVDCGSSGTRANIYVWNSDLEDLQLLHNIEPMKDSNGQPVSKKIKPGLASLKDNPDAASDYMKPIIDFISDKIPGESLSSAGIYIMCTAGMRLLEPETQLSIMNDIVNDLKTNYNFAKVEADVISGAKEGIYQWITVNSRLKRFFSQDELPATYAVMEMGGASTQITYRLTRGMHNYVTASLAESPQALQLFESQVVEPQMSRETDSQNFKIFSTSFLGFGSNSAREAYVDLLIMNNKRSRFRKNRHDRMARFHSGTETLYLSDPCLPLNSVQKMKKPKRMLSSRGKTIGFMAEDDEPTFEVRLIGKGKFHRCRMLIHAMLQLAKNERLNCKSDEPCPMSLLGTPFVPYKRLNFIGLGEFYYTTKEMMNLDGTLNRNHVAKATRCICASSYESLLKSYPEANKHDSTRVLLECFKAVWIDVFLSDGTKVPSSEYKLQTIGQINGQGIDWTLGAILDKSLAIERATEDANIKG